MRVSVAIPTYNAADRLGRSIATVLSHVIIVVDDGSTDATPSVRAGFGMRTCTLLVANGGQQRAGNFGVAEGGGEWIALLVLICIET